MLVREAVLGLKAGGGESVRDGVYPVSTRLRLVDRLDREWRLEGAARIPSGGKRGRTSGSLSVRLACDARTGLGEAMDFLGMSQITALYNGLGS